MRTLIMKTRCWIAMILLPLAMTATATIADGQGKGQGKAQGGEKAGQGQGRGDEKAGKGPVAKPSTSASGSQEHGPPQNAGQMRAAEVSRGGGPGRSAEHVTGNTAHTLPASPNASPRASVAAAPNPGRAVSRFERDLHVSEVRPVVRAYVVSNRPSEFVTGGAVAYALARGAPDNALLVVPASTQVLLRTRKGDRLALHDVTLGYTDPLTGVWHSEATGPDVLFVNSGNSPIAELVDTNRDGRPELMLVALRPW